MLRALAGGLALVVLSASVLYARQGTVVTKDGHTYEGDVTEQGADVQIAGVPGMPGPLDVKRANVASISYADTIADEVRQALIKLPPNDVKARIELARVAIQSHAYQAANDALKQAAAIDPNNHDVADLLLQVAQHLPAPATNPAVTAPATNPTTTAGAPATAPVAFSMVREVTPAEINAIRQFEWRGDQDSGVRIQIKPETKKRFLEHNPDIAPADFNHLAVNDQAALILSKGAPELFNGVMLMNDPATVAEFKRSVNRIVLQGCASAACHGGHKAGPFVLANPASNNAGLYTNFLVLQQYAAPQPLVDRVNPASSLLLEYMLPPNLAVSPHPPVPGYKGMVRTKNDPRYLETLHWIQSLDPKPHDYGIDLSTPAREPKPKKKPAR